MVARPQRCSWPALLRVIALCATAVAPPTLAAEICPTGPTGTDEFPTVVSYRVTVTPDGARINQPHDVTARTSTFLVANIGTCPDTFNFTASGTGPITGVTRSPTSATHKHAKVRRWLARHPRYHVHFTPTYAS